MTTTPPREWARTPPAPLYGPKYDDYEPYEIRKSTRLSKKQANRSNRTPSPGRGAPEPVPAASYPSSSRASHSVSHTLSPPPSNQPMSRKKFVDGSSLEDVFLTAADEEGAMGGAMNMANGRPGLLTHELLPTPAKTPRKRQPQPKGMGATARVLFPTLPNNVEEAMPMPKKGRKGRKANGFSLGGLANEDDDNNGGAKIQIYTDSKDRVPELDPSEDNPFYVSNESGSADLSKQKSAGKAKAARSTETRTPRRDDGIVYVL
ncbi:hypothetical protein L228DRAFT_40246 [Xylona heveae TC161]|uniref:Uncharacterized protein n=1 Tax=Xylona heveae (strain CBS 132557 / TC161) TaxID=1328760 RepID=A0A164ZZY6_XYLHT|nr:hypothetical protein L228DRAFT_40246 [Xylona heveae TC161]KZF19755.1 hypothetical protein L228DRAFT_40246 [Xylona heveae TC161]